MFVIVFGQLALVLFCKKSNTYGSVFSFFVALLLRLLCGDKAMNLPPSISFGEISVECPTEDDPTKMCTGPVPFRTIVAIIGIVSSLSNFIEKLFSHFCILQMANLLVSYGTDYLFTNEKVSLDLDFFGCYKYNNNGEVIFPFLTFLYSIHS